MPILKIETPAEFFAHIVQPDVEEFAADHGDLRAAYHAATSLLSYRDWVLTVHRGKPWSYNGSPMTPVTSKSAFQQALEGIDHAFAIITDIANASKHMILQPALARTNLWGNANTAVTIMDGTFGGAPFGAVPFNSGSVSSMRVKIDSTSHDVPHNITAVHRVWVALNSENAW